MPHERCNLCVWEEAEKPCTAHLQWDFASFHRILWPLNMCGTFSAHFSYLNISIFWKWVNVNYNVNVDDTCEIQNRLQLLNIKQNKTKSKKKCYTYIRILCTLIQFFFRCLCWYQMPQKLFSKFVYVMPYGVWIPNFGKGAAQNADFNFGPKSFWLFDSTDIFRTTQCEHIAYNMV